MEFEGRAQYVYGGYDICVGVAAGDDDEETGDDKEEERDGCVGKVRPGVKKEVKKRARTKRRIRAERRVRGNNNKRAERKRKESSVEDI